MWKFFYQTKLYIVLLKVHGLKELHTDFINNCQFERSFCMKFPKRSFTIKPGKIQLLLIHLIDSYYFAEEVFYDK